MGTMYEYTVIKDELMDELRKGGSRRGQISRNFPISVKKLKKIPRNNNI